MDINAVDWLQAAHHEVEMRRWRDQSNGKTKKFSVTRQYNNITPGVIGWYMMNRDNESYRLWHPAHIAFQWENKTVGPGATWIGWEKINNHVGAYRMRILPLNMSPISIEDENASSLTSIIDTENEPVIYILNTIRPIENGTEISATFVFPEATPDDYMEAHKEHYLEEFPNMISEAIPFFIRKNFGYLPPDEVITKTGLLEITGN